MEAPTELAPTAMGELVDSIAEYNNSANAIGFSVYYYIDQMYSKPGLRLLAVDGVTLPTRRSPTRATRCATSSMPPSCRIPLPTARSAGSTSGSPPMQAVPALSTPAMWPSSNSQKIRHISLTLLKSFAKLKKSLSAFFVSRS